MTAAIMLFFGIVVIIVIAGGVINSISAVNAIKHNGKYPNLTHSAHLPFLLTMLVSALPVGLVIGFAMFDHYVKNIDESLMVIILPIIFSPLFVGSKLKLNFLGLFMGMVFWMGVMVALIMTFG